MVKEFSTRTSSSLNAKNGKNHLQSQIHQGLKKNPNTDTDVPSEARNDGTASDVRQVYDYEYTPPKPKGQSQSQKRRVQVILKNRAAGKTVGDAKFFKKDTSTDNNHTNNHTNFKKGIKGQSQNQAQNQNQKRNEDNETNKEEDDMNFVERAFLGLGYYVGEGAVAASKKVSEMSK